MDIRTSTAAQSYAKARTAAAPDQPSVGLTAAFERAAESFTQTLAQGEETARAAMTGKADPHALVEALAASQMAVETAVTLRDKVVEAYQEILRMPV
ncbi:flagellar hook-basal body complex protein FliE [Rhodobacter sphaeroides]|jgi:Flagellar hook-basal body protein|uniref:Flagellar hook-basal body complex protein n=1 Tax=Cereibacter sphaeroides (strain ATCC 17023 / DSM 158 / JCM 6121 / CCUG 31486 / LMG 2827 / NBRC 12203 / NCIMB 8253 / ATH 2.4.1.) TaxID=272943 RepID=Q3IY74_CERS4|nr:flagellar hook-basal body complex protein FliE [Cereibacter sphaeroides]ABA80510.1 putative flagellar hook-basal body complex protein [Cereibacter sphaeroides 2.4.1]AMJ48741.1 flagellar hook-basal body protein FliE [Cereibacter sphaeroides]ANS35456.1 flagellar hook-basal body protein FliE [Cereibacter sphaeroides]ATN64509.1 flagellar hook-basal body protein FliE [Cereibacter sphaeroides]AXC62697.1 flagellar hook-basal body complex protein FliE [Cereibacter sphaeroides 2.4.1]